MIRKIEYLKADCDLRRRHYANTGKENDNG